MKQIVNISLGSSQRNYSFVTTVLGQHIEIQRIGTDGNIARAATLVQAYDGKVHALSLEGLPHGFRGNSRYATPSAAAVALTARVRHTPVVDGNVLSTVLERWVIKRAADMLPHLFRYRRVLMVGGGAHVQMADVLAEYEAELRFVDPLVHRRLPFVPVPRSIAQVKLLAAAILPLLTIIPYRMVHARSADTVRTSQRFAHLFRWADVIVCGYDTLHGCAPLDLRGRTIVSDDPAPTEIEDLRQQGVGTLITLTPPLSQEHPFVSTAVLEAIATVILESNGQLTSSEVLNFIDAADWEPTITELNHAQANPKFAFVIHPLKTSHIYHDARFRFARYFPQRLVEYVAAFAPPIYLARMRGIRSRATGKEIEGLLITLGATPRELLRRPPTFTYRRLVQAARMAERMGARVMGLGAFTSIVGDAGVTVAQKSDIGITTGNALTVAVTLEAAQQAVMLMGGRMDRGRAIVIGATGSIGSVCARLLTQTMRDVVLIAPRPERLLLLKKAIERDIPDTHVTVATSPDDYLDEADLIVTTTNALTGNIIDIDKLKPGAVVCDVARPHNVHAQDAARRPDVLVIESGEILLPGNPDLGFDIDLPTGTAYACLAETALLAMEGKFADYTLGRSIEIERVTEMHALMQKHGMELAGLRSFGRYITEADIAEKRRLADERRQQAAISLEHAIIAKMMPEPT